MVINPNIGSGSGEPGEITVSVASSTGIVTAKVTKEGSFNEGDAFTLQLSKQAAKTVTPSTSAQTAVAKGKYTTGAIKVAANPYVNVKTGTFTAASTNTYTISGLTFKPANFFAARIKGAASASNKVSSVSGRSYTYVSGTEQTTANGTTTYGEDSVTLKAPSAANFGATLRYVIW